MIQPPGRAGPLLRHWVGDGVKRQPNAHAENQKPQRPQHMPPDGPQPAPMPEGEARGEPQNSRSEKGKNPSREERRHQEMEQGQRRMASPHRDVPFGWPPAAPVAVQMMKMTLNCRAHLRAVSTFRDFLNSVQLILSWIPYIQNTHDLRPFQGATHLVDGYPSLKSHHPSQAGVEGRFVESDEGAPTARPSSGRDPAWEHARHSFLTVRPKSLHSGHIIIVGS